MSPLIIVVLALAMILVAFLVYYQNEQESLLWDCSIEVPSFLCGAMQRWVFVIDSPIGRLTRRGASILDPNDQEHEFDELPNHINKVIQRTSSWHDGRIICAFDPDKRQISLALRVEEDSISFVLPKQSWCGLAKYNRQTHYTSIDKHVLRFDLSEHEILKLICAKYPSAFARTASNYIVFTGGRGVLIFPFLRSHTGGCEEVIGLGMINDIFNK